MKRETEKIDLRCSFILLLDLVESDREYGKLYVYKKLFPPDFWHCTNVAKQSLKSCCMLFP